MSNDKTITISIDDLRSLIGITPTQAASASAPDTKAEETIRDTYPAIVRTYADGVWVGTVVEERGCRVVLKDCRCLWSWSADKVARLGLPGVAAHGGPAQGDRLTALISRHICIDAVGITPIDADSLSRWLAWPTYTP